MFYDLFEGVARKDDLQESSIDYPRTGLPDSVWEKTGSTYKMRPEVKEKIYAVLATIPLDGSKIECEAIHLVGSLCTNQYIEETDCDIHIQPVDEKYKTEDEQKRVMKWVNSNRDAIGAYIDTHPIEVFIQLMPEQDYLSDGCYDVINDVWLTGPKIVDADYDPYEDFTDLLPEVEEIAKEMDIKLGELKRDIIDFDTIESAILHLPLEQRDRLYKRLEQKRDELEEDVKELYKLRKTYVDARHSSSKPKEGSTAKDDVEMAKRWRDANVVHKFMHRYKYSRLVGDLGKTMTNDQLTDKEIDTIKGMLV